MPQSVPSRRLAVIERIAASVPRGIAERDFARHYYRGVGEQDLAERHASDLAEATMLHRRLGAARKSRETIVRVFNPSKDRDGFESTHTLVAIVTDDMPFLVDSIGMVFAAAGVAVHLIVHPVLQVARDARGRLRSVGTDPLPDGKAESWQLYEIDRQFDDAQMQAIERRIRSTLSDVQVASRTGCRCAERCASCRAQTRRTPAETNATRATRPKRGDLMQWMEAQHFVFLGYRHYRLRRGRTQDGCCPMCPAASASCVAVATPVRDQPMRLHRHLRAQAREARAPGASPRQTASTVHRATHLDYVGVKTFDADGQVNGEHRFVGLWTSTAYSQARAEIPLLRRKVARVIDAFRARLREPRRQGRAHVLETYPRDELFQASVPELVAHRARHRQSRTSAAAYACSSRPRRVSAASIRAWSTCRATATTPRCAQRIEQIVLQRDSAASHIESQVQISRIDAGAAARRLVRTRRSDRTSAVENAARASKREIAEAAAHLARPAAQRTASRTLPPSAMRPSSRARYAHAFRPPISDEVAPSDALEDIADLEALATPARRDALRLQPAPPPRRARQRTCTCGCCARGEPIPISDVLPMIENFGLRVIAEHPYELELPTAKRALGIQDFELERTWRCTGGDRSRRAAIRGRFPRSLAGDVDNDGFNRLLLARL